MTRAEQNRKDSEIKTALYRRDPEFSRKARERARENHERYRGSRTYRELIRTRKTLWQLRESLSRYRSKIKALQQRIARVETKKEMLELDFGQERARQKRRTKPEMEKLRQDAAAVCDVCRTGAKMPQRYHGLDCPFRK